EGNGSFSPSPFLGLLVYGLTAKKEIELVRFLEDEISPECEGILKHLQVGQRNPKIHSSSAEIENVWATMCSVSKCLTLPCGCWLTTPNSECLAHRRYCREIVEEGSRFVQETHAKALAEQDEKLGLTESLRAAAAGEKSAWLHSKRHVSTMWTTARRLQVITQSVMKVSPPRTSRLASDEHCLQTAYVPSKRVCRRIARGMRCASSRRD
ncbi:hypothetical protein CYMTET_34705, partial [Cymbomonas tetramitiformis]